MGTRLVHYKGFLTTEKIAFGMTAAGQNAKRLADDAQRLFDAERYPSALSLAVLSLEESGKHSILREMSTATTGEQILGLSKRYRRHTSKHTLTLMPERIANGARRAIEFAECVEGGATGEKATYDSLKQIGFYTDCLGKGHWSIPTDVIGRSIAEILVRFAITTSATEKVTSNREIELWVTHMQAGFTRPRLIAWASAMVSEGLSPDGYVEEMAEFTVGLE